MWHGVTRCACVAVLISSTCTWHGPATSASERMYTRADVVSHNSAQSSLYTLEPHRSQGTKSGAASSEEDAQKAALINQVLELQNTLDGMCAQHGVAQVLRTSKP